MRATRPTFPATLLCAIVAICAATVAKADGVCVKDYRDSTPAERARMTAVLEIVKRSLPPAPAGWQIGGYEEISVATSVCRDVEVRPWSYNISRTYNRVDDYEARQKIMRDAAAVMLAEQARRQPLIDSINAQMTKLSERQIALVQKGDMDGAQKLNYDMAALQDKYKKAMEGDDSEARIAAAGKLATRDQIMTIHVTVNEWIPRSEDGAASIAPPAGASAAERWTVPGDAATNDEGHARVLLGSWNRNPRDNKWQGVPRANAVPTAAHVITVEFAGDPARVAPMLQAINFQNLATAFTK